MVSATRDVNDSEFASPAKSDTTVFIRLLKEGLPYWKIALLAVAAMIITAGLEPLLPALMAPLIDDSMIKKDPEALLYIPILIVLVYVIRGLFEFVAVVASQYVAHKTIADIRAEVFASQLDLPMEEHHREEGGMLISRITYDCAQIREALSSAWMVIIKDSLVILGLLVFLIYTSWEMSITLLIATPAVFYIVKQANRRMRISNRSLQDWNGRLTGLIEESLAAVRDIKVFEGHSSRQNNFERINSHLFREQMRVTKVQALATPLIQTLTAIVIGIVIFIGTHLSVAGELSPGEFVAYITAMGMIFSPIRRLTGITAVIQRGLAAAESIYSVLDQPLDMQKSQVVEYKRLDRASIKFEQVTFQYPGADHAALSSVSFEIDHGESIALVGPSGSGKTSTLALIAGFVTPDHGTILFNEENVLSWPLGQRRRQLAYVSQQINLFDTTVAENIRFGKPDATEEEVHEAARQAHALKFIEALPEGFETQIGPFGSRLSGGERQRLAIARAFIKNAPILLLDEPTSALDHQSREHVLRGLENLKANRTTLIISHQPETLLSIDRTLYLIDGHLTTDSSVLARAAEEASSSRS